MILMLDLALEVLVQSLDLADLLSHPGVQETEEHDRRRCSWSQSSRLDDRTTGK